MAKHILIDALDECTDCDSLLEFLEEFINWNLDGSHMFVASRKEEEIENVLQSLITCQIDIQGEAVDSDIQIHIQDRVSKDTRLKKWPLNVKKEIEDTLMKGAKSM